MATLKTLSVNLELLRAEFSKDLDAAIAGVDELDQQVIDAGDSIYDFDDTTKKTGADSTKAFQGVGQGINEVEGALKSAGAELANGNLAGGVEDLAMSATNLTAKLKGAGGAIGTIAALAVSIGASIFAWRNRQAELNAELERTTDLAMAGRFADALGRGRGAEVEALALSQQLRDATTSDAAQSMADSLSDQGDLIATEWEALTRDIALLEQDIPDVEFKPGLYVDSTDTTARDEYIAQFITPLKNQLDDLRKQGSTIAGAMGEAQRQADSLKIAEEVQAAEDTRNAALVERLGTVGEFFNALPEAVEPLADNLVAAENQLRAFDEQMQVDLAKREAEQAEHLQELADMPAQLTSNMQRGSAEAFRTILQQQQDRPFQRLESVATQQLAELRRMNERQQQRSRASIDDEPEDLE